MTFAEQLQAERKRLGMTRLQMAELLSVSPRLIAYWEDGEVTPHVLAQEGTMARISAHIPPLHPGDPRTPENTAKWEKGIKKVLRQRERSFAFPKPKKPAKRKPKA